MGNAAADIRLTVDKFLAWDATQSLRHEFVAGEIFAMAGAEDRHVTIAGNVYMALRRHPFDQGQIAVNPQGAIWAVI